MRRNKTQFPSGEGNALSREAMKERKDWLLYQSRLRCRAIRRSIIEAKRAADANSNWGLSQQAVAAMVAKFAPQIESNERMKRTTEAAQAIYRRNQQNKQRMEKKHGG